jgi:hypothetical protein
MAAGGDGGAGEKREGPASADPSHLHHPELVDPTGIEPVTS